jgi:glycerol kinase
VEAADTPEGTCLGAALLGGLAAGLFPDLRAARAGLAAGPRAAVGPDPGWPEAARERRLAAYASAYARVRGLNALLREATSPPEPAPAA